jgi:hypothetical protein
MIKLCDREVVLSVLLSFALACPNPPLKTDSIDNLYEIAMLLVGVLRVVGYKAYARCAGVRRARVAGQNF